MTISAIKGKHAFTFIEIFFVIILIGILLGAAIPRVKRSLESLELNNFSGDLQDFMRYLKDRAVVEGKIIVLKVDQENLQYWAGIKDNQTRFKTYLIPKQLRVTVENAALSGVDSGKIFFYPDGQIDKVNITIGSPEDKDIILTTKGVFGGVKTVTEK